MGEATGEEELVTTKQNVGAKRKDVPETAGIEEL